MQLSTYSVVLRVLRGVVVDMNAAVVLPTPATISEKLLADLFIGPPTSHGLFSILSDELSYMVWRHTDERDAEAAVQRSGA